MPHSCCLIGMPSLVQYYVYKFLAQIFTQKLCTHFHYTHYKHMDMSTCIAIDTNIQTDRPCTLHVITYNQIMPVFSCVKAILPFS